MLALIQKIICINPESSLHLENERLKLALEKIINVDPDDCYGFERGAFIVCQDVARKALN